jgi:hypothetical protein
MGFAARDGNDVPTLTAASSVDGLTPIRLYADPTTHRLLVDLSGGVPTFVFNEIVSGSGTSWTLAGTPTTGTVALYANGQRLMPGVGDDYTISGANITTALSWSSGTVLADYQTS